MYKRLINNSLLSLLLATGLMACHNTQSNIITSATNGRITLELEFVEQLILPDGTKQDWTLNYQQPYLDAANKWLDAVTAVTGQEHHIIRVKIIVADLDDGNGMAGPDDEVQLGNYHFATLGTMVIGNHTYTSGFDPVEFHANILHEFGHIIGIGSSTQDFIEYYPEQQGNVLKIDNSIAAAKYNELYQANERYLPLSDDGGHLYDYVWQEDKVRTLSNGQVMPPLTKEFMANGAVFGTITLAVLDDIGFDVNYAAAEPYFP